MYSVLASSVLPRRKCVSVTVYSFALRNHTHSTTAVAELDSPGECAQSTHFLVRLCDGPGPAKPWDEPGGLEGVAAYSRSRAIASAALAVVCAQRPRPPRWKKRNRKTLAVVDHVRCSGAPAA